MLKQSGEEAMKFGVLQTDQADPRLLRHEIS